jgi:hypothetical protein
MSSTIASPPAAPSVAPAPAPAPAPTHRSRKQLLAGLILVLLVAAAGVFAVPHFRGQEAGPSTVSGPQGAPFTLKRPAGWNVADAAKLGSMPGKPLAVLNRTDGKGLIVVNRRPKAPSSLRGFSQQLDSQLAKRVPDFKRISARTVRVRAGEAFLYTYVRKSKGTVNSVVVVPGKTHTYVLNAVVPTGARAAARQVGAMLASFDTQH